jgi:hypothetical protein
LGAKAEESPRYSGAEKTVLSVYVLSNGETGQVQSSGLPGSGLTSQLTTYWASPLPYDQSPPTSTKLIKTSSRYGHVPGKRPNRKLTTTRNSAPSCYGDEDMAKAGCMIGNGRLLLGVLRFLFVEFEEFGVIDADVFQNLPFWLE